MDGWMDEGWFNAVSALCICEQCIYLHYSV